MSSNTYARLCDEVYKRILGKLERREEEERRFAVNGTARKVLDDDFLKRFFRSLCLSAVISMEHGHINESDLIRKLDKRNLYDFLAIMLFTTCTVEAARTFTIELLINDSWPPDMFKLPVGREQLRELFREDITPDKFLAHQACFCPVTIVKGREYRIKTPGRERLPYLEETLRAKGSFGAVYTVKIAKGHFYDPQTELANRHPMTVARKDYLVAEESARDQEVMKKILSADRACKNIVDYYGSVAIGLTTYSLFMPMAICDLKDYMMELHKTNPNTISDKAGFIRCAHGLAGGLNFLHNGMRSANGERLVCYHMDLKPSNILIYRDTGHAESPYIWKISDFGMSRVKVRRRGDGVDSESNFNSWFLRRPKAQEPSTSGTMNRRGEGTYLAPEAIAATPTMKTGSDVWSLGCVISVLFAYLEEGALGVDRYSDKRGDLDSADGYDRFFIRTRGWGPFKPHPVVKEWHERLIHHAKQRNRKEADAVEFMLGYLDNWVFKEQSKRCNVAALENMLWYTYIKYIDADPASQNPESHKPARAEVDPIKRPRWWRAFQSQNDPAPNGRVNRWLLDSHEAFKGWAISPEGFLIAFWTDSKISLYTSESLHPDDTRVKTLVPEFTLDDTGAIWKSISLTEKHLIAFTSGDRPQCYKFDLYESSSVEANLQHHIKYSLPISEIMLQAISPGSQTMACVLRDSNGDQNLASLFLAPVASPKHSWWLDTLNWPAKDIIQLFFTTDDDLYLVVRPQLSARSREHKVRIIHIDVSSKRLDTLVIESRGLDSSINVGLFTTFVPFRQEPNTFAIVTRERQLHIRNLAEGAPRTQAEIEGYRVLRLMMGWDDTKIFAIGTPEASLRMVLLEIKVPRGREKRVSLKEIEQLPGLSYHDDFTEVLSYQRGEKYVLIAALTEADQHAIYEVALTDSDSTATS